jgi:hypothetical protein
MYVSKRLLLPVLVIALAASSLVFALGASAERVARPSARVDLLSPLAPSLPTDPTIHGVAPGGAPWALTEGNVLVRDGGRVQIRIDRLVLTSAPFVGKTGPVTGVVAALFCGADANTTPAATTAPVPLSSGGNASISTTVPLPSSCLAPIVLIHPVIGSTTSSSIYIALSGFAR